MSILNKIVSKFDDNHDVVQFETVVDGRTYYGLLFFNLITLQSTINDGYNRATVENIKPVEKKVVDDEKNTYPARR